MKRSTSFLVRVALMAAALALAVVFVGRGADSPAAEATSYNPSFNVSVSDPTPGATADVVISFSVDKPDSFPNVRTNSSIQFIPKEWGVHTDAPIGASAGTFNAFTTLGIFGMTACVMEIPVPFAMMEASVDTSDVTSALDIGGDAHPGGLGFSGQFAADPDTVAEPTDLNLPLINFNADEKYTFTGIGNIYDNGTDIYRDVDGSGYVSAGDVRLTDVEDPYVAGGLQILYPAGTVVQDGDVDVAGWITFGGIRPLANFPAPHQGHEKHDEGVAANGVMDPGEHLYRDMDESGTVTHGDIRQFNFAQLAFGSVVALFQLPGGVHHYPDFLNELFPPAVVGDPLTRMFGVKDVLGTPVSLNIVTFRPGQLPDYPASLGYPNVVVLLDPVAPIEAVSINKTSDLCTPLTLVSTNYGVSQDNPATWENESGYVRLTNPGPAQKDYPFTLVTTSQPDADDDGIENMLDTCPLTPNVDDDARTWPDCYGPDFDSLDSSCDPDPANPSPPSPFFWYADEDQDNYVNRADNCPTVANGIEITSKQYQQVPGFAFWWAITGDLIGPSNQIDSDGDDLGDACDPDPDTITGHMHEVWLTQDLSIAKHGIKLNNLGGPKQVKHPGARSYSVDVSNLSATDSEDIQVALRVAPADCATVSGPSSVNVGPSDSGTASFTVDWTGCPAGLYIVQADACHAGDPAPAGFFGSGACPGTSDGKVDTNADDDGYRSKPVTVGP
jgi:hypothetical protein